MRIKTPRGPLGSVTPAPAIGPGSTQPNSVGHDHINGLPTPRSNRAVATASSFQSFLLSLQPSSHTSQAMGPSRLQHPSQPKSEQLPLPLHVSEAPLLSPKDLKQPVRSQLSAPPPPPGLLQIAGRPYTPKYATNPTSCRHTRPPPLDLYCTPRPAPSPNNSCNRSTTSDACPTHHNQ